MKINIYYGGRGIVDDPSIYVINKMQEVLHELNVNVTRYNLYEQKNSITSLPATLNDVDGIILATTVEWYGIGGNMQQFLDACWLFGNKEKISEIYMCPVVMSTTYGEQEGKMHLSVAWEILGGRPCSGIAGYVNDTVAFELNQDYASLIEKKTENLYRTISQKIVTLPASNQAVKQMVGAPTGIDLSLTPQETEQLSKYASDEHYVQQQKEDIQELTSHFKELLENRSRGVDENNPYLQELTDAFHQQEGFKATYKFILQDKKKNLIVEINQSKLNCYYGNLENPTVLAKLTSLVFEDILAGNISFQRAFMAGDMQVKGDFRILRMLDQIFVFSS